MSRFVGKAGFYLDRQLFPSSVEMSLGGGGGGGGLTTCTSFLHLGNSW